MEEPNAEQANQDQIDGDDNVKKARDDKNKNARNECDDRLQMRNTNGHDLNPLLLIFNKSPDDGWFRVFCALGDMS
jgi:hypothetical protein